MKKNQRFNHKKSSNNKYKSSPSNRYKIGFYLLIISSALLSQSAIASEIYGRVSKNGAALPNASISITCPNNFSASKTTDNNGVYRTSGPAGEKQCSITVNNSSPITFFTSSDRTRVNLDISNNTLQRR